MGAPEDVEDIYPCTPVQESLVVLSERRPGTYIMQLEFLLQNTVDLERLRLAWKWVADANPVLRSTIVRSDSLGLVQAVLRGAFQWSSAEEYSATPANFLTGHVMSRFTVVKDSKASSHRLIWTIHHALLEGWSIQKVLEQVQKSYRGIRQSPVGSNFRDFIAHTSTLERVSAMEYWTKKLVDYPASDFPQLPSKPYTPKACSLLHRDFALKRREDSPYTSATVIRAAWALLLARYSGANDVSFGAIMSGRTESLPGIDELIGPTMATVPVRLSFEETETIAQLLERTSRDQIEMMAFEQIGISNLRTIPGAEGACMMHNILVIQPKEFLTTDTSGGNVLIDLEDVAVNYAHPLNMEVFQRPDDLHFKLTYDENVLPPSKAQRLLEHFEIIIRHFNNSALDTRVGDVDMFSNRDREDIMSWNEFSIPMVDECVHGIIAKHVSSQPDHVAIESWDGKLTYKQLYNTAEELAAQLANRGVGPESIAGLIFGKSIWAAVSMLAVLIAGGKYCPFRYVTPDPLLNRVPDPAVL